MRFFLSALVVLLLGGPAGAQTYFARLNQDNTVAQLVEATADNASVPASCPGCSVVTKNQYDTYAAQVNAAGAHAYIARADFWDRFTDAEKAAVVVASRANTMLGNTIAVWLVTAQIAEQIDLLSAKASQGLDVLVTAGIIDGARKTTLLTP